MMTGSLRYLPESPSPGQAALEFGDPYPHQLWLLLSILVLPFRFAPPLWLRRFLFQLESPAGVEGLVLQSGGNDRTSGAAETGG